ncbi:MAG: DNA replication/repair protein RecF [Pseudomonadota bacterium]|jgi:DNA replication and repair protein RecF|nr:DNA replication/repair protein RecF [Pseudomonadota bacterium]
MSLGELQIQNLRCIGSARLELHPRCTLIWGGNGAGKTSLLEAAFLLGRGRSFRSPRTEQLVGRAASKLTVFGRIEGPVPHAVGVEFDREQGSTARIDAQTVKSLADLSLAFPVQVIDPEIHKLIEEGGRRRRRWLDWAVFHVEPQFGEAWFRYARALRQRNAALKGRPSQARPWEAELVEQGTRMSTARRAVLERLEPYWTAIGAAVACPQARIGYAQGWAETQSLSDALESARARDEARQTTTVGPHRADLRITLDGRPARDILSRGQQKLTAAALTLAQLRLLADSTNVKPTLLLDDPAAELDTDHQAAFVAEILRLKGQLVVTALQPHIPGFTQPDRVFHVEQGDVRPV